MSVLATMVGQAGGGVTFVPTLTRGLAQGAIYALIALGFVLVFKATQTVNFAQGALALVGTWFFSMVLVDWRVPGRWLGDNRYVVWFSALITALALAVVLGLVIERLVIRPMIGEPLFSIAVITLGLEAVLRTVGTDAVAVNNRNLGVPWGATGFQLGGGFVYWSQIATIAAAALAFAGVYLFFRTRTGVAMRAVAFDQEAAMAQGISVGRVFAIAWGAGAALAVVGALCASMSPIGLGTATAATSALAFRALPAVILGGLDSVVGALIGGLVIGLSEVFAGAYLAEYTTTLGVGFQLIVPYIAMLIVLLVRPYGLFGTPEIRRV
ncbi:MAG: branched-chain amino acid ABC transporter permease [Acidimicrobiia bacterium]|nr:branched-chain amino acid ABC transporter permease [Acidimicrobiia bacterium]